MINPQNLSENYAIIYRQYLNSLLGYGMGFGISKELCMDGIQEVFCRLFSKKIDLNNKQEVKFFLFRCLKNCLINLKQKKDSGVVYTDQLPLTYSIEVTVLDNILDEEQSQQLKTKVENLLSLLSDRQREAIYLRYMQEMEYEEIAVVMKLNPESVRKLVYRGMKNIRKQTDSDTFYLLLWALLNKIFFN